MERLKLKEINCRGERVDKEDGYFAPVLYDGKIKIYGSNIIECNTNGGECIFMVTKFYLKNQNSADAIAPADYDIISIFNGGNMEEKMMDAFIKCRKQLSALQHLTLFCAKKMETKQAKTGMR